MKTNVSIPTLLQMAKALARERRLQKQIDHLRKKMAKASTRWHSWGWSESDTRADVTLDIELADYLSVFAEKNPVPMLQSFEYESHAEHKRGTRQYFEYPAQYIGNVNPKLHVWAKAQTQSVWADGWVEWNPPAETVEPAARFA
jgi:hypothetical protein